MNTGAHIHRNHVTCKPDPPESIVVHLPGARIKFSEKRRKTNYAPANNPNYYRRRSVNRYRIDNRIEHTAQKRIYQVSVLRKKGTSIQVQKPLLC